MLHHSSKALESIRELNRPSSRKSLLGMVLVLIVVLRKVGRMLNGTLSVPLNIKDLGGGI
jgi:hypothetical protein